MSKSCPFLIVICLKPEEEARLAAEGRWRKGPGWPRRPERGTDEQQQQQGRGREWQLEWQWPHRRYGDDSGCGREQKQKPPTRLGFLSLARPEFPGGLAHQRRMELGVTRARSIQGRGYGGEAINRALDRAFLDMGLHKVFLHTHKYNTRAIRTYKRLGFHLDGTARDQAWFQRRWWDSYEFSMLEDEWEALRDGPHVNRQA